MAFNLKPENGNKKIKTVGQLRRTQLITTFGSGAIVDMPDYSVVIAATNYWNPKSPVLHEPNLQKLLKVPAFKEPYVDLFKEDDRTSPDIPAFRFPIMHFCPDCGRLMPYWGFGSDDGKTCKKCGKNIVPSRFIAACINGHMEDFPYNWWVHSGDFSECPQDGKNDNLKITFSDETGGLEGIIITCTKCNTSRSMAGCMKKEGLLGYHCRGSRPWIGIKKDHYDPVACNAIPRGLQRGASNVYFGQTESALTIPPRSSRLQLEIEAKWEQIKSVWDANKNTAPEIANPTLLTVIGAVFYDIIQFNQYTAEGILEEIRKTHGNDGEDEDYSLQRLYEDEYQVFCMRNYEDPDDVQFRIESTDVPDILKGYIEDIILVKRLREVLALKGFRRISPDSPNPDDDKFKGYNRETDCVPLSDTDQGWLPAIEMLGEGLFIKLDEDKLNEWENRYSDYYEEMGARMQRSTMKCEKYSPRYVLLHTLSHLLIRQLTIECGYSGAAIKERIYSTYPDSECKMAGILLYTSSSDSDGSLGGLVRNGLPENFERVFRSMLQEASWCSSDPICIKSKAQGFDSLNYAACHACTLLPETSCEMRNCLLDRNSIVGSIWNREMGYFSEILEEGE